MLRNWKWTPVGMLRQEPGPHVHDNLVLSPPAPELACPAEKIPELLDRLVGDGSRRRARRKREVVQRSPLLRQQEPYL